MAARETSPVDAHVSSPDSMLGPPQRAIPNLTPVDSGRKGSLPKGCRFRDLSEAHRNITGRSISASHGGHELAGSLSRSTNHTDLDASHDSTLLSFADSLSPREDTSPAMPRFPASPCSRDSLDGSETTEGLMDRMFDRKGTRSCSPALMATPSSSKQPCLLPKLPLSEEQPSPLSFVDDTEGLNRSSDSHMAATVASTDTTIGRLYTQYQTHILNPLFTDNSSPVPVIKHVVHSQPSAVDRVGLRSDGQVDTPTSSSKKPGLLLTVPTRESLMYPKPLRVQSIRAPGKHTSLHSGIAVSATGMTTDSEEDPFRYDKDAYSIFLHPSKERDVSAALNHISGISSHSQATLYSQEDGLLARKITLQPPPIPKAYLAENPFLSGPTGARSPTPDSADGFYDTSIIQPNWATERSAYEVKVVLQDVSRNTSTDAGRRSKIGNDGAHAGEKTLRSSVLGPYQDGDLSRRKNKENMPSSERDDWETVATTAAGFGSMQRPLPGGERLGVAGSRGFKITGSSVADVSDDDNSFRDLQFDEYASTDRIVQHPSGHGDSEESLQIRQISGTKFPVMIPKQRVHRVNGFPQNSARLFPASPCSGSEAAAALARKVSSPFRQISGRRPHRFSPMPLQPLLFKVDNGKNRFEFRPPSQNSDCDPLCTKGGAYTCHGVSSDTGNTQSETTNVTVSGEQGGRHGDGHSLCGSSSSQSSNGTVHSFPFPLIPLPEAARLQAVQRAATSETLDADPCWSRSTEIQKRARVPGRIRVPERAHPPLPTRFASVFSPSSTQSSRRGNRLRKTRKIPRDRTMQSDMTTTTAGGTWTTILPLGSTSTRNGRPSHMLKSAATRLHLDDLARRLQELTRPSLTGSSSRASRSSGTPRLYPWDYQARRRPCPRGTDPELRAIALAGPGGEALGTLHDLERSGVPLDPEAFISREGRRRRQAWFYGMLAVSLFPFISVLVYRGTFDSGLSWYSRGEVDRLNTRQQRVLLLVMVAQFVLWPLALGLVIWRAQATA